MSAASKTIKTIVVDTSFMHDGRAYTAIGEVTDLDIGPASPRRCGHAPRWRIDKLEVVTASGLRTTPTEGGGLYGSAALAVFAALRAKEGSAT